MNTATLSNMLDAEFLQHIDPQTELERELTRRLEFVLEHGGSEMRENIRRAKDRLRLGLGA